MLELIIGPMYAGKSTTLLSRQQGRTLIITHDMDSRGDGVRTHDGVRLCNRARRQRRLACAAQRGIAMPSRKPKPAGKTEASATRGAVGKKTGKKPKSSMLKCPHCQCLFPSEDCPLWISNSIGIACRECADSIDPNIAENANQTDNL